MTNLGVRALDVAIQSLTPMVSSATSRVSAVMDIVTHLVQCTNYQDRVMVLDLLILFFVPLAVAFPLAYICGRLMLK